MIEDDTRGHSSGCSRASTARLSCQSLPTAVFRPLPPPSAHLRRRVQQMVQLAHDYLIEYLTNKRAELAEQLFDEGVVHKDVVGAAAVALAVLPLGAGWDCWCAERPSAGWQTGKEVVGAVVCCLVGGAAEADWSVLTDARVRCTRSGSSPASLFGPCAAGGLGAL